jgi:hypothetical protein
MVDDVLWLMVGEEGVVETNRFPRAIELEHPLIQATYRFAGESPTVSPSSSSAAAPPAPTKGTGSATSGTTTGSATSGTTSLPDFVWMDLFLRYGSFPTDSSSTDSPTDSPTDAAPARAAATASAPLSRGGIPSPMTTPPVLSYALQLQNTRLSGGAYPIDSLRSLLSIGTGEGALVDIVMEGCLETTLSMQEPRAQNEQERLVWSAREEATQSVSTLRGGVDGENGGKRGGVMTVTDCDQQFTLAPLEIRAFTFSVRKNTTGAAPSGAK